jgi:hypothetical protein
MNRELENVLRQMIAEHRAMLKELDAHQAAIRALDLPGMNQSAAAQETIKSRIAMLENKRRLLVQIEARNLRLPGTATLMQIAEADPSRRDALLALRQELRDVAAQIADKTHIAGRVTGAILGHLNTAVRLISSTVQHAGTYTKHGTPRVSQRIGVMEAVA